MMRERAVRDLSAQTFDLVVIGGGIYGASVARDAALRGLKTALVEKGDFGQATSSNSHKILHGGLRYLQHLDISRMRESIRERGIFMRIAPHLAFPMPFLIPTYKSWAQGKLLMSTALRLNDLVGFDRNNDLPSEKQFPRGRIISKAECLDLCPGLDRKGLTGGAVFYDGQLYNPDRFILSVLFSARDSGAVIVNYMRAEGFLKGKGGIAGIKVRDACSRQAFDVRARLVVNCCGPWAEGILSHLGNLSTSRLPKLLKAVVLVTRPLSKNIAVGVPGGFRYTDQNAVIKKGHRYFFITPWRDRSLVGTFQRPFDGTVEDFEVNDGDIEELLQEINIALPGASLGRSDVYWVNRGLLPRSGETDASGEVQWVKQYQIIDHAERDGVQGLITTIGVKFTTARDVAEKVVDLAVRKLQVGADKCTTSVLPVYGGDQTDCSHVSQRPQPSRESCLRHGTMEHLLRTYGSGYSQVLRYGEENGDWLSPVTSDSSVLKAEIVHAVREEMAQKLEDVVLRRTELGTAGYPGEECLSTCAQIMASELGWSLDRMEQEVRAVRDVYARRRVLEWAPLKQSFVS